MSSSAAPLSAPGGSRDSEVFRILAGDGVDDKRRVGDVPRQNPRMIDQRRVAQHACA